MGDKVGPLALKIINLLIVGSLTCLLLLAGIYIGSSMSSDQIIERYHILAYSNPAMWRLTWLGIPTQQNPNDVWITQEIISEIRPDFIIETGTQNGGSSVIWAMIQREVNPTGRVITIDIEDKVNREKLPRTILDHIDFVTGSSVDPNLVANIGKRVEGKRVVVILDSDHHKPHVLRELRAYSSLVSTDSYMIVQDTNVNGHPIFSEYGPGPMEAVKEFLESNDQFKADLTREKLLFTMHPNGFLKRIRPPVGLNGVSLK